MRKRKMQQRRVHGFAVVAALCLLATVARGQAVLNVTAGAEHTCALLSGGSVQCWGRGTEGQRGTGGTSNSAVPVAVSGLSDAVAVDAGGWHTCVLLSGGSVRCWGYHYHGQLGNGGTSNSAVPVLVLACPLRSE